MTFGALYRSRHESRRRRVGGGARIGWFALCGACIVTVSGMVQAQSTPEPASGPVTTEKVAAVSGNPAAATFSTGSGWLGRTLGLRDEWASRWAGCGSRIPTSWPPAAPSPAAGPTTVHCS